MAERRMFAKTIVLSDEFLDMPLSARCLYFTLGMFADDDGFVNSPKSIMRQCGASQDDMSILLLKKFVLAFDNGIIVIKHWRINNYLRNDRYSETKYLEEKEKLVINKNGSYSIVDTTGIPSNGIPSIDKVSIDKNSIDKNSVGNNKRFTPPTVVEVKSYCDERMNNVDPEKFVDFYSSKGWMVGKNHMKDWKAAVRNWEKRDNDRPRNKVEMPDYMIEQERKYGW